MTTHVTDATAWPPLDHREAMDLQATELARTLDLLQSLDDDEWAARTDCPDWDIRRMYLHVLGACDAGASMRENVHQLRAARRRRRQQGGPLEAALSSIQVEEREHLTPGELVERLTAIAPRTIRGRTRMPALVRRMRMSVDGPVVEKWTLGYLVDTIYLRDLWMHRIDAARATGRDPVLTAEHDGRIVADVVAEWARRHGRPFSLTLTGPAGGTFAGTGAKPTDGAGEAIELDAVAFCRTLGGRDQATGLLATVVPF